MSRPLVMISNDDGIRSPGLAAMADAIAPLADLVVVAPTKQQSAMGRSLVGMRQTALTETSLNINGSSLTAYHCDCSPAQAVHFALNVLCRDRKPDLLVSGINYGENLGTNITISGTVGAALEAANRGIPALAMSLETAIENHTRYETLDWSAAQHFGSLFAAHVLKKTLPRDVDVINVNVPHDATCQTAWRITKMARHAYFEAVFSQPSLASRLGDAEIVRDVDPRQTEHDTDIHTVHVAREVSVTPLSLDLSSRTDRQSLTQLFAM